MSNIFLADQNFSAKVRREGILFLVVLVATSCPFELQEKQHNKKQKAKNKW